MNSFTSPFLAALCLLGVHAACLAQTSGAGFERLPAERFDIRTPALRVSGAPGEMRALDLACHDQPLDADLRRRIVHAAVQEWAFFGFGVDDQTALRDEDEGGGARNAGPPVRRPWYRFDPEEAARLAPSIGGYWASAPDGAWILARQNESWRESGLGGRWRDPWSAAFISWVMCESGLGESERFRRSINHHTYIDQAIRARDQEQPQSAYVAYDLGEADIFPGDILCRGSRPAYKRLADRRAQLGQGARTHCDIVVKVDEAAGQILVVGGNVRGSVRMKVLPAAVQEKPFFAPLTRMSRPLFAHLQLRAPGIEDDALDRSPTLLALRCEREAPAVLRTVAASSDDDSAPPC